MMVKMTRSIVASAWRPTMYRCYPSVLTNRVPQVSLRHFPASSLGLRAFSFHSTNHSVVPFVLADIGEGITECEIMQWYIKENDVIAQFDKICEVQSDKAAVEISSRFDGTVTKLHYQVGDLAKVGTPLIDIQLSQPEATAPPPPKPDQQLTTPPPASKNSDRVIFATPAVRRLAREHKIDLAQVTASGKGSRILKTDVHSFMNTHQPEPTPSSIQTPAPSQVVTEDIRPLTAIQKAMYKSMTKSLSIPQFGYCDELRMDALASVRDSINQDKRDVKISFMPLLIKSFSLALLRYPILNAQVVVDPGTSTVSLVYRSRHNISIAMDTPSGLVVPNIKDVQTKSVIDIATELGRLQLAAEKGALTVADLQGGTISLSNIGSIGGTYCDPVVVASEVCIVALGKSVRMPRFNDAGRVEAHLTMPVSLSADHRVIDGATAARFVQLWKKNIELPMGMLAVLK